MGGRDPPYLDAKEASKPLPEEETWNTEVYIYCCVPGTFTTKTPVCESVVHSDSKRTVNTVLSKNVLKSECLFVVSYAIIYFSKYVDFKGRWESTMTAMHNSLLS